MKKILGALFGVALLVVVLGVGTEVRAADPWMLTSPQAISFTCGGTYNHMLLTVVQDISTGDFTGTGHYVANTGYMWDVTGNITGDGITFTLVYNAGNPGYTLHGSGAIANDGSIVGTVDNNCTAFTMQAGAAVKVDMDTDDDGVLNDEDYCSSTAVDEDWDVSWGTNRLEVRDTGDYLVWFQNRPGKKGILIPTEVHDLEYTYGCNGHQILEMLHEELGSVMEGHHKFGLSSSVVDDFHLDLMDGELDGVYFIETVTVPANDADGVYSVYPLINGMDYKLRAYGTANAGDTIDFDAQYSLTNSIVGDTWTDAVTNYESYGTGLLDLFVDGADIDWGAYNAGHVYEHVMTGLGTPVHFGVYDVYPPNNTGNLYVDIIVDLH